MDSMMDLSARDAPSTRDSKASTIVDKWDEPGSTPRFQDEMLLYITSFPWFALML